MQSTSSSVWEWFLTLSGDGQLALLTGVGFFLIFAILIVASTVSEMQKHRLENELKRELLERGMSADEIATVVASKPRNRWLFGCGNK